MEWTNRPVAFFDGTDLKLLFVDNYSKGKVNVRSEHGRQFKVPFKNIIQVLETCSYEHFSASAEDLQKRIIAGTAAIESELLWELISDNNKEYELNELSQIYFGQSTAEQNCSLFLSLLRDTINFKRKGISFSPRTAKQVEEQKLTEQRRQEKDKFKEKIIPWLARVIKQKKVDAVPEMFQPVLNQLEIFLYSRQQNEASKLLTQVIGNSPLREAIFSLLSACGKFAEKADKFLILAGINENFSKGIQEYSATLDDSIVDTQRQDLTNLLTFTIDDEETMDMDDAFSVEFLHKDQTRVYVHIADVSSFVFKGDFLDLEASQRVTSIYLPTKTVNMFPENLSQNIFSLVQGTDRRAMTFIIDFDENDKMTTLEIVLSKVHINKKLTYKAADDLLQTDDEIAQKLNKLNSIAHQLMTVRKEEGAAIFNRPELKIRVNEGQPQVTLIERHSPSRNLVSEFMILANSAAASYCVRNDVPIIFRVQDKPEDLPELNNQDYDPIMFERMIKCMKKSRLSLHPQAHGGLGVDFYTQLTSPIRRYTDLIMQRQLSAYLKGEDLPYEAEELMSVLAMTESTANEVRDVQRQAESYWLHVYIKQNMLGEECEATVLSRMPGGYLVELDNIFHKSRLMTQDKLNNGARIKVTLDQVKPDKNFIQMTLV